MKLGERSIWNYLYEMRSPIRDSATTKKKQDEIFLLYNKKIRNVIKYLI